MKLLLADSGIGIIMHVKLGRGPSPSFTTVLPSDLPMSVYLSDDLRAVGKVDGKRLAGNKLAPPHSAGGSSGRVCCQRIESHYVFVVFVACITFYILVFFSKLNYATN